MSKGFGSVIIGIFLLVGFIWFWQDSAGFLLFVETAIKKGADLVAALFEIIFSEVQNRSSG